MNEKKRKIITYLLAFFILVLFALVAVGSCGGIRYLYDNRVATVYADTLNEDLMTTSVDISGSTFTYNTQLYSFGTFNSNAYGIDDEFTYHVDIVGMLQLEVVYDESNDLINQFAFLPQAKGTGQKFIVNRYNQILSATSTQGVLNNIYIVCQDTIIDSSISDYNANLSNYVNHTFVCYVNSYNAVIGNNRPYKITFTTITNGYLFSYYNSDEELLLRVQLSLNGLVVGNDSLSFTLVPFDSSPYSEYTNIFTYLSYSDYEDLLNNGYDEGYSAGVAAGNSAYYNSGFSAGYNSGYNVGLSANNQEAYDSGYSVGYDEGLSANNQEAYDSGYAVGKDEGINTGYQWGYDRGYELGTSAGYDSGYDEGYQDGLEAAGGSDPIPSTQSVSSMLSDTSISENIYTYTTTVLLNSPIRSTSYGTNNDIYQSLVILGLVQLTVKYDISTNNITFFGCGSESVGSDVGFTMSSYASDISVTSPTYTNNNALIAVSSSTITGPDVTNSTINKSYTLEARYTSTVPSIDDSNRPDRLVLMCRSDGYSFDYVTDSNDVVFEVDITFNDVVYSIV